MSDICNSFLLAEKSTAGTLDLVLAESNENRPTDIGTKDEALN